MGADSRQERGGLFSTALLTFDEEKMRRYQSAATLHAVWSACLRRNQLFT